MYGRAGAPTFRISAPAFLWSAYICCRATCLFLSLLPALLLSILKYYHLPMAWPLLSLSHTHRRPSEGWGHLTSLMGRREVSLGTHGSSHRVFIFLLFRFFQLPLCFLFPIVSFLMEKGIPRAQLHFIFTVVCCAEGSFSHSFSEFLSLLIWIYLTPLPDFGVLFSEDCEAYLKSWVSLTVRKDSLVTVTSRWSNGSSLPKYCTVLVMGNLHPEILFFSQAHCGLFTFVPDSPLC